MDLSSVNGTTRPPVLARHFLYFCLFVLTMYLADCVFLFLVRYPRVGLPHGVTGWRPDLDLPSPPPCGWSTGFIAAPLVCGLIPMCLDAPALPMRISSCSALPTVPTVALHSVCTFLTSLDGSLRCTKPPSRAIICAEVPALRTIFAPCPGLSSTAWTMVPRGMMPSGIAFPGLTSTPLPDSTMSPTWRSEGHKMYLFCLLYTSPSPRD